MAFVPVVDADCKSDSVVELTTDSFSVSETEASPVEDELFSLESLSSFVELSIPELTEFDADSEEIVSVPVVAVLVFKVLSSVVLWEIEEFSVLLSERFLVSV